MFELNNNDGLFIGGQYGFDLLGIGSNTNSSPIQISGVWKDYKIEQGCWYGIKSDDTLWVLGNNIYGQLGDGTTVYKSSPVQIDGTWKHVNVQHENGIGIKTDDT